MAFVDSGRNLKIFDYERLKGRFDIKNLFVNEISRMGNHSTLSCVSIDINNKSVLYGSVDGRITSNYISNRFDMKTELTFKSSLMRCDEYDRHLSSASLLAGKTNAL